MNIGYEFSKIKDGFSKVRTEMNSFSEKINENYEEFMKNHKNLSEEVSNLSAELKANLFKLKINDQNNLSEKDIANLKYEIKELKKEINKLQHNHNNVILTIDDIKKNSKNLKEFSEKQQNSELEIYLLKERMIEKDIEIKQIKDINKHIFEILDELSKTELDFLNIQK